MAKPLAIDIFCGLGGWTKGLLAEGYRVVGFDIERHYYPERIPTEATGIKAPLEKVTLGERRERGKSRGGSFNYTNECAHKESPLTGRWMQYPAQLVLQDARTIHGRQFKDAALIVASPPCQEYSYMAMPWSRAKQIAAEYRDGTRNVADLTALFDACFRIQREACEAAGRHIPLVVENVRGAQEWVGRARWHYGSFYLWGDVPALMPMTKRAMKNPGFRFDGSGRSFQSESVDRHIKNSGGSWFNIGSPGQTVTNQNPVHQLIAEGAKMPTGNAARTDKSRSAALQHYDQLRDTIQGGLKQGGDWFNKASGNSISRRTSSRSSARKAASAHIAKIPFALSSHIARAWYPA